MIYLVFYTTEECHLCEKAALIIDEFQRQGLIVVQTLDIAKDDRLLELYGIRIPVLKRQDSGDELGWPFGRKNVVDFIRG